MTFDLAAAREILVRGPNWLGDLVMATPALHALRHACPDARITLWVRAGLAATLAGSEDVDRVFVAPARRGGLRSLSADAARVRNAAAAYDLGLCLPDSVSSALSMRLAGARPVVGFARGGRAPLLDVRVPRASRGKWVPREQSLLDLVGFLGAESRGTALRLATTAEEEASVDALLANGRGSAERVAVLAPGAGYGPAKRWPTAAFAQVGDALAAEGIRVVLVASPAEAAITAEVAAQMAEPALDVAARLDVGILKALIRRAGFVVGNDSGTRHVAAAFGIRQVVLFGPTAVEKTALNLSEATVQTADVACRPCYLRHCPIDQGCLVRIDPESVSREALAHFGRADAGAQVAS